MKELTDLIAEISRAEDEAEKIANGAEADIAGIEKRAVLDIDETKRKSLKSIEEQVARELGPDKTLVTKKGDVQVDEAKVAAVAGFVLAQFKKKFL